MKITYCTGFFWENPGVWSGLTHHSQKIVHLVQSDVRTNISWLGLYPITPGELCIRYEAQHRKTIKTPDLSWVPLEIRSWKQILSTRTWWCCECSRWFPTKRTVAETRRRFRPFGHPQPDVWTLIRFLRTATGGGLRSLSVDNGPRRPGDHPSRGPLNDAWPVLAKQWARARNRTTGRQWGLHPRVRNAFRHCARTR